MTSLHGANYHQLSNILPMYDCRTSPMIQMRLMLLLQPTVLKTDTTIYTHVSVQDANRLSKIKNIVHV